MTIGALASVLQKIGGLEVASYSGHAAACLGGVLRIVLGGIFGAILLLAAKMGIALSAFVGTWEGIYLIGFAGGISERLVPEVIAHLEAAKNGSSRPVRKPDRHKLL